ncbi:unnamed protein product, partial [marine sediment metagenome]
MPFGVDDVKTREHVPPKSIFAKEDRNPPLILPAHLACNQQQSGDDEIVGQLVAVAHGGHPDPERSRLQFEICDAGDSRDPVLMIRGTQLERLIWRWIRGFHAALYREYLPPETEWAIHIPFWRGSQDGDVVTVKPPLPQEA